MLLYTVFIYQKKRSTLSMLDLPGRAEGGGGAGNEERKNESYRRKDGASKNLQQLGK